VSEFEGKDLLRDEELEVRGTFRLHPKLPLSELGSVARVLFLFKSMERDLPDELLPIVRDWQHLSPRERAEQLADIAISQAGLGKTQADKARAAFGPRRSRGARRLWADSLVVELIIDAAKAFPVDGSQSISELCAHLASRPKWAERRATKEAIRSMLHRHLRHLEQALRLIREQLE
jgi:hypothetical protein